MLGPTKEFFFVEATFSPRIVWKFSKSSGTCPSTNEVTFGHPTMAGNTPPNNIAAGSLVILPNHLETPPIKRETVGNGISHASNDGALEIAFQRRGRPESVIKTSNSLECQFNGLLIRLPMYSRSAQPDVVIIKVWLL